MTALCIHSSSPLLCCCYRSVLSCVRLLATPWTAARQASLSLTISRSLLKLMSTELVMPSNHLILCCLLLLLPSIFLAHKHFRELELFFSFSRNSPTVYYHAVHILDVQ